VQAVIPAKRGRRHPALHDRDKYRLRNRIERLFSKLKNWRRIATRYDKTKESYLGFVSLASINLWLPFVHVA
jgi:transposase